MRYGAGLILFKYRLSRLFYGKQQTHYRLTVDGFCN